MFQDDNNPAFVLVSLLTYTFSSFLNEKAIYLLNWTARQDGEFLRFYAEWKWLSTRWNISNSRSRWPSSLIWKWQGGMPETFRVQFAVRQTLSAELCQETLVPIDWNLEGTLQWLEVKLSRLPFASILDSVRTGRGTHNQWNRQRENGKKCLHTKIHWHAKTDTHLLIYTDTLSRKRWHVRSACMEYSVVAVVRDSERNLGWPSSNSIYSCQRYESVCLPKDITLLRNSYLSVSYDTWPQRLHIFLDVSIASCCSWWQ